MLKKYQSNKKAFNKLKALTRPQRTVVAKIAKKVVNRNEERKQYAAGIGSTAVYDGTAGSSVIHLSSVSQGLADNQRAGDEINIRSLRIRINCNNNFGNTANDFVTWRVIVFQYKNSNMAPTVAELFLQTAANGGTDYGAMSSRNIDYLNTYNVLYDKIFHTEQGGPNAANYAMSGQYCKVLNIKVPLKYCKKKIQYQAATTNNTNGLWLCVTTDKATIASNPHFIYDSSLGFTDS